MKKTKYLVAALLLMGATTTFTSCIDNDEPAGITELRGAKAELLRAKAVVEQARAQYVLALAEHEKALAAVEMANARYREAQAKQQEAKAEWEAANTEAEKARFEQLIAYYKNLMEEQALWHQKTMVEYQQRLEEAQRNYEVAMKQIEIAEAIMSDEQKVSVGFLKNEVNKTYAIIYGGQYYENYGTDSQKLITISNDLAESDEPTTPDTPETMSEGAEKVIYSLNSQIFTASENLYDAMLDKASGTGDYKDLYIPELELDLEEAKADLAAEQNKVNKIQEFIDGGVENTDWAKKIAELNDSIAILNDKKSELDIAVDEAKATPEYLKAAQAYRGINKDGDLGNVNATVAKIKEYKQKGTAQKLTLAKTKLTTALGSNGKAVTVKEFEVEASNKVIELVNKELTAASKPAVSEFVISEITEAKELYELNNGSVQAKKDGQLDDNVKTISSWVEAAGKASASANDMEQAKYLLEEAKKDLETARKNNEEGLKIWQASLKASRGELSTTDELVVATKSGMEEAVNKYNAALTTLKSAVDAYNSSYNTIKENATEEGEAKFTAECTNNVYSEKEADGTGSTTTVQDFFNDLAGRGLIASAPSWSAQALNTEAFAMSLIEELMKAKNSDVKQEDIAKEQAKLKKEVGYIVNTYLAGPSAETALEAKVNATIYDALDEATKTDKELDKLKKAVESAEKDLDKAFGTAGDTESSVAKEYADWISSNGKLAKYYAMQKDGSKTFKSESKYVDGSVLDIATETISGVSFNKSYKVKADDITSSEYAEVTKIKVAEGLKAAAHHNGSVYAFGNGFSEDRYVPATEEEMRETYADLNKGGTYGKYLAQGDVVKTYEERVAAADDLKKVVEDLTKMLADYKAEIESVMTEAYGEQIKVYEDAVAANNEAKAAYQAENLKIREFELEAMKVGLQIEALDNVASTIATAVKNYLELASVPDYKNFEKALNDALIEAKDQVVQKQKLVAQAESDLQEAQEGKYDSVAKAQRELDNLMAELAIAQKNYDTALANLETALEIMAKTAE